MVVIVLLVSIMALLNALLQWVAETVRATATIIGRHPVVFSFGLVSLIGLAVWVAGRTVQRRRTLAQYLQRLAESVSSPSILIEEESLLKQLRERSNPLSSEATARTERLYRELVCSIVMDGRLTGDEMKALSAFERITVIAEDIKRSVRLSGFHQAVESAIADGSLSSEEDQELERIRTLFTIDPTAARGLIELQAQFRRARAVRCAPLQACEVDIKLRRGELCYWHGPAIEQALRAGRGRDTAKMSVDLRAGELYLTSDRFLLVGDGALSISLSSIHGLDVSSDRTVLVICSDTRKTPYRLRVGEPFVLKAFVNRLRTDQRRDVRHVSSLMS